jgi:hypothetical protein
MKRIGEIGIDINGNFVKILYGDGTIMEQNTVVLTSFLPISKALDNIINAKTLLINDRNKIIDSPLKLFLPYYKKRLARIDNQIDELDSSIYELEKSLRDLKVCQESINTRKKTFNPFQFEPHTD